MKPADSAAEYNAACKTPLGWVAVRTDQGAVTAVSFEQMKPRIGDSDPLAGLACEQLQRWLAGGTWPEEIPLAPAGTPFQRRVWQALQSIPAGTTLTYGELASKLGTSARAVGGACRANPIPLLIPCHRVIAAHGDGGFGGHTSGRWMEIKRWLLAHDNHDR